MEKFFVAHHGIQKGPWSIEEITKHLEDKTLQWNDYIFDENSKDWILILESPHFTQVFNQSFKNPIKGEKAKNTNDPARERSWYILKQENNYGPFTQLELIQMLQSKTLFEFDFVWKQGLDSWKRLADVNDFSPDNIKKVYESLKTVPSGTDKEIFFRRKHARVQYGSSLILHDQKQLYKAESLEISAGGAGFLAPNLNFELDKKLYLHFKPSDQVPAFNAICKVVSHVDGRYGVKFMHVSAAAKEFITEFAKKAS